MENPNQQVAPNANGAPAQAPAPSLQEVANATPQPAPAPSPAKQGVESAIISRLANQRDGLRTENKMLREEIKSINAKIDMLLGQQGGFGNEETKAKVAELNRQKDLVLGDLEKDLNTRDKDELIDQAGTSAIGRVMQMLEPTGINMNDLNDPDIKLIENTYNKIWESKSTDFSDLLVLGANILAKRLSSKTQDPAKLIEEGKKQALEGVKKLGSVNVEVPGTTTAVNLADNQRLRRLKALQEAKGGPS